MTEGSALREADPVERQLVVIAAEDYPETDDLPAVKKAFREGMEAQIAVVKEWVAQAGSPFAHRRLSPGTIDEVEDEVRMLDRSTSDTALLIYVTAHGVTDAMGEHYLVLPKSSRANLVRTAYRTDELITRVVTSDAEHVVVLIDSCYSGALAARVAQKLRAVRAEPGGSESFPRTCAVIAAGYAENELQLGDFTRLLARALEYLGDQVTPWFIDGPFASPMGLRHALRLASEDHPEVEYEWVWPDDRATSKDSCPVLPNPTWRPREVITSPAVNQVAITATAVRDYWALKASGRSGDDDPGWYFSGRVAIMSTLVEFLREGRQPGAQTRLLLVTGDAGSGKSAVLARAVTLADPLMRSLPAMAPLVAAVDEAIMPPEGSVHVAVLARGESASSLVAAIRNRLTEAFGTNLSIPDPDRPHRRLGDDLVADLERLSELKRPICLVIDGLDESTEAPAIISEIIQPLMALRTVTGAGIVRVLLGLRSIRTPTLQPQPDSLHHILRESLPDQDVVELRTDGPDAQADILDYLQALLMNPVPAVGSTPYQDDPAAAAATAAVIARAVTPSFLDANVIGSHIRVADQRPDLNDRRWRATLRDGSTGQLRADLQAVARETGTEWAQLVAVLRATAMAQGAGVPWEDTWPVIAQAILGRPLPADAANRVIRTVLTTRLAGYLTTATIDGQRLFRPHHERLTEVLRDNPAALRPVSEPA